MTEPDTAARQAPPGRRRLLGWATNLALILGIFLGIQWWMARPLATGEAPPLTGTTLSGELIDLNNLRGQPVLVYFWATWCPVCKLGNGAIEAIAKDHRVLSVAMQSGDAGDIQRFMAAQQLSFPTVADDDGMIAGRWGVAGVPASFVIDARGQIGYATMGLSTDAGLRARLWAAARHP